MLNLKKVIYVMMMMIMMALEMQMTTVLKYTILCKKIQMVSILEIYNKQDITYFMCYR